MSEIDSIDVIGFIFLISFPFLFLAMIIWMANNHPSTWKHDPLAKFIGSKNKNQRQINQVQ